MADDPMDARHLAESAEAAGLGGAGCSAGTAGPIGSKLAGSAEGAACCGLAPSASPLGSLATGREGALMPDGRGDGAAAGAASAATVGTARCTAAAASGSHCTPVGGVEASMGNTVQWSDTRSVLWFACAWAAS